MWSTTTDNLPCGYTPKKYTRLEVKLYYKIKFPVRCVLLFTQFTSEKWEKTGSELPVYRSKESVRLPIPSVSTDRSKFFIVIV